MLTQNLAYVPHHQLFHVFSLALSVSEKQENQMGEASTHKKKIKMPFRPGQLNLIRGKLHRPELQHSLL